MVDNLIKLFDSNETEFETNGIGVLPDAETCEITEERNGEFELEMDYPINGRHYNDIRLRKIIVTKSNPYSKPQPFRIYSISKPIDGIVTINAEHISYDLSGYPVSAFSLEEPNTTVQNVFDEFKNQCVRDCPFTFWTNKIATGTNAVSNGKPSGGAWVDSDVELMNEIMVYGCPIFAPACDGSNIPYLYTTAKTQLSIFRLNMKFLSDIRSWIWLRDVVSANYFAIVLYFGHADYSNADNDYDVLPYFLIGS